MKRIGGRRGLAKREEILIIGSGLAGMSAGRFLNASGYQVTILDKGFRCGGRYATRRVDDFSFDHGTPYFKPSQIPGELKNVLSEPYLKSWPGDLSENTEASIVSIPAMRSFPEALGRGLDIRQGVQVEKLSFRDDVFFAETVDTSSKDMPTSDGFSGPFDAVLLTAPGPQTADLIEGLLPIGSDLLQAARKVTYTPQFSVLVGYDFMRDAPSIIHNPTSKIAKIVNQAKKPDRPEKSAFVVFCSPEWSLENLDKSKDEVAEIILKDLENILSEHGVAVDDWGKPAYLAAHSWRYCRLENPAGLSPETQLDATSTLAVAGDWIMLPDTHGALSSGINAARQIETKLSNRS